MALNRIEHQKFSDNWRVLRLFGHVFAAMFDPIQHITGAVLETLRLGLKPSTVGRRLAYVPAQRAIAIIRGIWRASE